LQQVRGGAATVNAVDPRRLPVPSRRVSSRALVAAGHVWVLHRRKFVQGFAAVLCCVLIVLVYNVRDFLVGGVFTVTDLVQAEVAEAGFAIDRVEITGQSITPDRDIVAALALDPAASTLEFDAEAARARIQDLPAIETATVRKVYPDHVIVKVTEKLPVARWRVDGVTFVVDAQGEQIGEDRGAYGELPLVVGDGAADDALVMIRAIDQYESLKTGLVALSRIGDRRWDLIYQSGLRVQLPELGVAQALVALDGYQRQVQLLDRDITLIDLRVDGLVAVKPTVREDEEDAEGTEKKKTTTPPPTTGSADQ